MTQMKARAGPAACNHTQQHAVLTRDRGRTIGPASARLEAALILFARARESGDPAAIRVSRSLAARHGELREVIARWQRAMKDRSTEAQGHIAMRALSKTIAVSAALHVRPERGTASGAAFKQRRTGHGKPAGVRSDRPAFGWMSMPNACRRLRSEKSAARVGAP